MSDDTPQRPSHYIKAGSIVIHDIPAAPVVVADILVRANDSGIANGSTEYLRPYTKERYIALRHQLAATFNLASSMKVLNEPSFAGSNVSPEFGAMKSIFFQITSGLKEKAELGEVIASMQATQKQMQQQGIPISGTTKQVLSNLDSMKELLKTGGATDDVAAKLVGYEVEAIAVAITEREAELSKAAARNMQNRRGGDFNIR